MTMDRHDTIGAMIDAYALGHLSPDERRAVESHARECEVCAAELRELALVMEGLAHVPEPATPSAALRQRVLSTLASLPQEAPRPLAESNVLTLPGKRTAARRGVHPGWLAAAALVVLAFGALLYSVNSTRRLLVDDLQEAQAETADLRRRLDQFTTQADLAVSILTAGDMLPVAMAGRENATASTARAYWSPTRGLLIVADNLPVPPPGRIYQVWVIGGEKPVSAGLLGEQGSARGMLIAPPPGGIPAGTVTVAVTEEPAGGRPAPSGTPRLVGST